VSPRNKLTITLFSLVFSILLSGISPAQDRAQIQDQIQDQDRNIFLQFYQDHISVADGNRCTMTPSCSNYAARAIQKHGAVIGWIMGCDRLLRCGRDEVSISPSQNIKGVSHTYDPVEANDFWWFNKPAKKADRF
jgi:putative component of membrane protein insertase Oxa1/YidC/SpoIIIJ protein YidD